MEEALRIAWIDHFGRNVPPRVVHISGVGANIDFLRLGWHNYFVFHARADLLEGLLVVVGLGVTHNADRAGPLGLLGAEQILIDVVLHVLDNHVDACANQVTWVALEVLLIASVVELAVSDGADPDSSSLEVRGSEHAVLARARPLLHARRHLRVGVEVCFLVLHLQKLVLSE